MVGALVIARAVDDPAARIATGIRQYCKRAHDDPDWANFLLHFGLLNPHIIEEISRYNETKAPLEPAVR